MQSPNLIEGQSRWIDGKREWSYFKYAEYALYLEWPRSQDIKISYQIAALISSLKEKLGDQLMDHAVGFHSCMIYFDKSQNSHESLISIIEESEISIESDQDAESIVIIPISCGDEEALDLESISNHCKLEALEVIDIFCAQIYTVHFQGFMPGFLYMGGLDERLHLDRRSSPRLNIPPGSVAIAAGQTGIYPSRSPGGWHIIGKTDIKLFDPKQNPPSSFYTGMKIKFDLQK